ncbi:serine/threonine-protein kinase [Caulobacter sp. S45]|uniref:serine/threonine-protein kinase n=1 Tax=Caulobacter sp. S45 TaxID=1641861 RepID=UPI00131C8FE8|nr:protein kinase [Caulobacter sp. S45]
MATIFGGRWKITSGPGLGQGGQGHVFPVADLTGEHDGDFALKRLMNKARFARFRNEVLGATRAGHPNVIKLVDHSPIDAPSEADAFLVMPIAKGGDLGKPDRLSLYTHQVEATLQVAKQVASGLRAAHAKGVIHRDVKPANILFTGAGHDLWLADFGLCLLVDDANRPTEMGEVVGPRAFIAPELEGGGKQEATAAADIYSLGKVIYYMLTGGVIIPRERGHEAEYRQFFETESERLRHLGLLVDQMVCPLGRRLDSVDKILARLDDIETWDRRAKLIPTSSAGLASIEKLRRQSLETVRIRAEDADARTQERTILNNVTTSFVAWAHAELEKLAVIVDDGAGLKTSVAPIADAAPWRPRSSGQSYFAFSAGVQLSVTPPASGIAFTHQFQVRLARPGTMSITFSSGPQGSTSAPQPVRDQDLVALFCYERSVEAKTRQSPRVTGFISQRSAIGGSRQLLVDPKAGTYAGRRPGRSVIAVRVEPVMSSFLGDATQRAMFKASQWPGCIPDLDALLAEASEVFFDFITTPSRKLGA